MLRSYLGDDSYQVRQVPERHTRVFRVWAVTAALAFVLLVVLLVAWPHR